MTYKYEQNQKYQIKTYKLVIFRLKNSHNNYGDVPERVWVILELRRRKKGRADVS